jgi:hypothetical protein
VKRATYNRRAIRLERLEYSWPGRLGLGKGGNLESVKQRRNVALSYCGLFAVRILLAVVGMALIAAGAYVSFFVFMFRIDSEDELWLARVCDTILGLVIGIGFLLMRIANMPAGSKIRPVARVAETVIIWFVVSGALLGWHELQVRARWKLPPDAEADYRVMITLEALADYSRDCGGFPSEAQGLGALLQNPGAEGWSGPYLGELALIDPWGQRLHYQVEGNRACVWSSGADRRSGTADDVRREVVVGEGHGR